MFGAQGWADARHWVLRANVLIPGLYAWLTTVAYPAGESQTSVGARASAYAALAALVLGAVLVPDQPRWARGFGVYGYVGLCLLSWALLGASIGVERVHPVRAACGGVGWALYAFSWGSARRGRVVSEPLAGEIPGRRLEPRQSLPRGTSAVLGLGVLGALVPWLYAWRITHPARAMFAHGAALLCAVILTTAAAQIALDRGKKATRGRPRARIRSAAAPASAVAFLLAAGMVWWALR